MSLPFATSDVLNLLGYPVESGRNNEYYTCPYCGRKKKLNFNFEKNMFRCNACGTSGNILVFFKDQRVLADTKVAFKQILKELKIDNKGTVKIQPLVQSSEKKVKLASISQRDMVYTKMLHCMDLSSSNRADLLKRGFTDVEIKRLGYKTFPADYDTKSRVMKDMSLDSYEGIPGFYVTKNQHWFLNTWKKGILVPYRDINGKIQELQCRMDNDECKDTDTKYFYVSSNGKKNGTSAKQVIHYACDFKDNLAVVRNGVLYLTEGAMKADLFHCISGNPVIAVPGVNCLSALKKELPNIKKLGVYRIVIAYDMDRVKNYEVLKALHAMKDVIKEFGFDCRLKEWGTEYVLLNGEYKTMNTLNQFVMTPDSIHKLNERKKLKETLRGLKEQSIDEILLAFCSSLEAKSHKEDYLRLKALCEMCDVKCTPCLWKLHCKGIDDLYAYEVRHVNP